MRIPSPGSYDCWVPLERLAATTRTRVPLSPPLEPDDPPLAPDEPLPEPLPLLLDVDALPEPLLLPLVLVLLVALELLVPLEPVLLVVLELLLDVVELLAELLLLESDGLAELPLPLELLALDDVPLALLLAPEVAPPELLLWPPELDAPVAAPLFADALVEATLPLQPASSTASAQVNRAQRGNSRRTCCRSTPSSAPRRTRTIRRSSRCGWRKSGSSGPSTSVRAANSLALSRSWKNRARVRRA